MHSSEMVFFADSLPYIVFIGDARGELEFVNKQWLNYSGMGFQESLKDWDKALDPSQLESFKTQNKHILMEGLIFETEYRILNSQGFFEWHSFKSVPMKNELGIVIKWFTHLNNIDSIKKIQEQSVLGEKRFRHIADETPAFIFVAGEQMQVEYLNRTWLKFTGMSFEDAKELGWKNVTHPDDLEFISKEYRDAFQKQRPYSFEIRQKGIDNLYRWILWKGIPRFDFNGQFVGMTGIGTDINDKIVAEVALRDSEKRFRTMADNIPNLAWMAHADGGIFWYNRQWYDYTGTVAEQMAGWGWQSVHDPQILPQVLKKWTDSIQTGKPFEMTFPLKRFDGAYRYFLTRVTPVKDDFGKIINWFGTNTDISDHLLRDKLLKEQNEELLAFRELAIDEMQNKSQILNGILEYTSIIVYKINNEGIITDSYGSALKSLFQKNTITGMKASDISLDPEVVNLKQTKVSHITHRVVNDEDWYYDNYFFPDKVSNNGVIGIGIDITELKELALQLQIEKERAVSASFFKTRFLANMSHEIRTPLNAILGFSDILSKQELSFVEQKEYLEYINSSGALLLKLIGDILDLSKIEQGKLFLMEESFHFEEVISSAILPYKYRANEKGLLFNMYFDKFIPQYVIGDAYRIKQIIINLIGNALKFTKEGSINIVFTNLQTNLSADISNIQIEIIDTGVGIEDKFKSKIFESFIQGDDTVARKYEGSGLGLAIVKQIVDLMKGKIWVEDNIKKGVTGTIFFLILPLKINRSHVVPFIKNTEPNKLNYKLKSSINVLVAEDNILNQNLIEIILKSLGAHFDIADNGLEAISMFNKKDYDVILMDVQMPIMDGLEATQIIRKGNPTIPVIALTANVYKEDIDSCISAGMNDHIPKPFNERQVFEVLSRVLVGI